MHELRGHAEKTPHGFGSMLYAATFSADGKHLATADKIGKAMVWEVATGKKIAEVEAPIMYTWDQVQRLHSIGGIRSLAFSPDGKTLAVGGTGKIGNIDHLEAKARIELFDWATQKRLVEYVSDKQGLVNHLEYRPRRLVAARGRRGRRRLRRDSRRRRQEGDQERKGRRCTFTMSSMSENARDGHRRRPQQDCGV